MMHLKSRAAVLSLGTVLSSYLKGKKGWRQPRFHTHTNVLKGCGRHCLPASDNLCLQLGHRSSLNHLPQQGYGTGSGPSVEGPRVLPTAVERPYSVGGTMALCLFNARNYMRNGIPGMVVVPTVPDSISKGCSAVVIKLFQARSLTTIAVDVAKSPQDSTSSPKSSHQRHTYGKGVPCQHDGCKVRNSNYGFPDADPTRCRRHMLKGMVIWERGCEEQGCNKEASFNFPDHAGKVRCKAHKLDGMVYKCMPVCHSFGCTSSATHGRKDKTSASYCKSHAANDMVVIHHSRHGRCQWEPSCMAKAHYGHASDKVKQFCGKHREPAMVDLQGRCEIPGCVKFAHYGWPDMGVWLRCSDHKEPAMVPKHACGFEGCVTFASFGFEGDKTASRCLAHKEDGMQTLRKKVCTAQGCKKSPSFGFEGDNTVSRCGAHKEDGMQMLWKRECTAQGCIKHASFGFEGETRPSRCAAHKEERMIHLGKKMCTAQGCMTLASFGFEEEGSRSRCAKHKEDGMQNLDYRPTKRHAIPQVTMGEG